MLRSLPLALAVAVALAACSGNPDPSVEPPSSPGVSVIPQPPPGTPPPQPDGGDQPPGIVAPATLRLLGANNVANAFAAAVVPIERVEITVDGQAWPFEAGVTEADLANGTQAWRLATFDMPNLASTVDVRVTFGAMGRLAAPSPDDAGPAFATAGRPVHFAFKASELAARRHAVLVLDVDRSVVLDGAAFVLLPTVRLAF
jgi:hypothetical protein